jgi:L-lactate utilization protein LutC
MQEATTDLFIARAEAAAAQVHAVPDEAAAEREVEAIRAEKGADGGALGERALPGVGVVRAARGIAQTGTCVVVADDEALRLETMLPEVSVILLNRADILLDLPSAAPFLREQQTQGRASYVSFITGPSRTADIERVSAIGVHGPLELHIVLIGGRP